MRCCNGWSLNNEPEVNVSLLYQTQLFFNLFHSYLMLVVLVTLMVNFRSFHTPISKGWGKAGSVRIGGAVLFAPSTTAASLQEHNFRILFLNQRKSWTNGKWLRLTSDDFIFFNLQRRCVCVFFVNLSLYVFFGRTLKQKKDDTGLREYWRVFGTDSACTINYCQCCWFYECNCCFLFDCCTACATTDPANAAML